MLANLPEASRRRAPSGDPWHHWAVADGVRIDRWLWSVRAFKTRTAATDAASAGRVTVNGEVVKPARRVQEDDRVEIRGERHRVLVVRRLIDKRVGASVAVECYIDQSPPPPERDPFGTIDDVHGQRERGAGRPTKRDRRRIDGLRGREGGRSD